MSWNRSYNQPQQSGRNNYNQQGYGYQGNNQQTYAGYQGGHNQYQHHGSQHYQCGNSARTPQPPPGIDPVLWGWFQSVDTDNSGGITADELQQALLNNNWSHFNSETCRLMIGMFDKDRSGTIDIYEFVALWRYVQDWKNCFDRFDTDRSGNIDANELHQAFSAFGYRLSADFCKQCVRIFDRASANSMKFDDFIQCCVMLKNLTDSFRKFDHNQNGVIQINYEQFLEMVLDNSLAGI